MALKGVGIITGSFTGVTGAPAQPAQSLSLHAAAPSGGHATITLAFATPTTAGNMIFVFAGASPAPVSAAISDTQGNTYTQLATQSVEGLQASIWAWWAQPTAGGANTVTVSFPTSAALDLDLIIAEYPVNMSGPTFGGKQVDNIASDNESDWWSISGSILYAAAAPDGGGATVGASWVITAGYSDANAGRGWVLTEFYKFPTLPTALPVRAETANAGGETAVLTDCQAFPTTPDPSDYMLMTVGIPAPVWPPACNAVTGPSAIAWQAATRYPTNGQQGLAFCCRTYSCGPFEHFNTSTENYDLYALLAVPNVSGAGNLVMYKSTDAGVIWGAAGGSGPAIPGELVAPPSACKVGSLIACLCQAYTVGAMPADFGGLQIWTFDMSTDAWAGTPATTVAPGTAYTVVSGTVNTWAFDWFLAVPNTVAATYTIVYTLVTQTSGLDTYAVWTNTWGAPTGTPGWIGATHFGTDVTGSSGQAMCGCFWDPDTSVTYVQYAACYVTSDIRLVAITNGAVGASAVILSGTTMSASGYNIALGVGTVYRNQLFIPYFNINPSNPNQGLVYVLSNTGVSGAWVNQQVAPTGYDTNQTLRFPRGPNTPAMGMCWCIVLGDNLYCFWDQCEDYMGQRLMFAATANGQFSTTTPPQSFFDLRLNPPVPPPEVIDAKYYGQIIQPSIAPLFQSRLGVIIDILSNLQGGIGGELPYNVPCFLPYVCELPAPAPPPTPTPTPEATVKKPILSAIATWYPQLDGLGLPRALTNGIQQAFALIYGLRDVMKQTLASQNGTSITLAGDLSGTSTSQTVVGLEGVPLDAATMSSPTSGEVITYDSATGKWEAQAPTGGGGGGGFTAVYDETPGGAMNGSNTSFTLAHTPSPSLSLFLFLNGVELREAIDYTISGSAITMAVAPKSVDTMLANYTY